MLCSYVLREAIGEKLQFDYFVERVIINYIAKNNSSLKVLIEDHNVELSRLPDDVLAELRVLADEVVAESVADDPLGQRILASFMDFREQVRDWHAISEYAYTDIINK